MSQSVSDNNIQSMDISKFRVSEKSKKALEKRSITSLFPIQYQTFDHIYDKKHLIGRARTGTGKTLAFVLPTVEALLVSMNKIPPRPCYIMCILPTRELAQQVAEEFTLLEENRFVTACVVGGLPEDVQLRHIRTVGANALVGTPGRVLDFLKRNLIEVRFLRCFILDEADQLLELGFREEVNEILSIVTQKKTNHLQVLFFSATIPTWVKTLSDTYMKEGELVNIDVVDAASTQTAQKIDHYAIMCGFHVRQSILESLLLRFCSMGRRCIVFAETKAVVNDIAMSSSIAKRCQALHGDIPQKQREAILAAYKNGAFDCLIATDVAARGLHIDNIDLVIHFEPAKDVDTFIHRTGRTGRAGKCGTNVVLFRGADMPYLKTIERQTKITFKRIGIHQSDELLSQLAKTAIEKLEADFANQTPDEMMIKIAKKLTKKYDPVKVIAYILKDKMKIPEINILVSALSGRQDYKAYYVKFKSVKAQTKTYVRQNLASFVRNEIVGSALIMLCADYTGAVFDIHKDHIEEFEESIRKAAETEKFTNFMSVAPVDYLPELNDPMLNVAESYGSRNPNARGKRPQGSRNFEPNKKFQRNRYNQNAH